MAHDHSQLVMTSNLLGGLHVYYCQVPNIRGVLINRVVGKNSRFNKGGSE